MALDTAGVIHTEVSTVHGDGEAFMATTFITTIITIIMWLTIMEEGIPESIIAAVRIEEVLLAEDPIQKVYVK